MPRKMHIVGNWKMNQSVEQIKGFFNEMNEVTETFNGNAWVAPQAIHISLATDLANSKNVIKVGAQNCSNCDSGAHTGEVSPASLTDMNVPFVILGHSERRAIYKESHEFLNEKVLKALENNLTVIFCVGELLEERESGKTEDVVKEQLDKGLKGLPQDKMNKVIIAYEPVWAIGTGKTATPEQADETQKFIREYLASGHSFKSDDVVILYGGSVKPANVDELLAKENIDGALVGGASLKASDFKQLCLATLNVK
jgi:triosephosphate isomerase